MPFEIPREFAVHHIHHMVPYASLRLSIIRCLPIRSFDRRLWLTQTYIIESTMIIVLSQVPAQVAPDTSRYSHNTEPLCFLHLGFLLLSFLCQVTRKTRNSIAHVVIVVSSTLLTLLLLQMETYDRQYTEKLQPKSAQTKVNDWITCLLILSFLKI